MTEMATLTYTGLQEIASLVNKGFKMEVRDMKEESCQKIILVYKDKPEGLCRMFIAGITEEEV